MRKAKVLFILIVATMFAITACKKNQTVIEKEVRVVQYVDPLNDWKLQAPKNQIFTLDAGKNEIITTAHGAKFIFHAGALKDLMNNPIKGNFTLQITEYLTFADMLFSGVTVTAGNELLESGGMFLITATQGNKTIVVNDSSGFQILFPKTNKGEEMMQFWNGEKNKKDSFNRINWIKNDSVKVLRARDTNQQLSPNYGINFNYFQFGYCNIDREAFAGIAKVNRLRIKLPDGCVDSNSTALLMFKDYNACAWCYWVKNDQEMSTYYNLPVGKKVKVLIYKKTGKNDNDISYAIKEITLESSTNVTFDAITPTTKLGLAEIIKGL